MTDSLGRSLADQKATENLDSPWVDQRLKSKAEDSQLNGSTSEIPATIPSPSASAPDDDKEATISEGEIAATASGREPTADPLRVADHQLLDALLEQSRPSRRRETAAVVDSVMEKLRANSAECESATPAPSVSLQQGVRPLRGAWRAARWISASLAASVLIAAVSWLGWNGVNVASALALAESIHEAAKQPIDREYRVEIAPSIPLAQRRIAKLLVRGGDRFVFDDPGPLGVQLLFGRDEKGMWQVPPVGPPRRGEIAAMRPVSKGADEYVIPYLQLAAVMDRVRSRYSITSERGESLFEGGPRCRKLSATLLPKYRETDLIAPETITIWSHRRTAVIERLELRWPETGLRAAPKAMVFQLAQQTPVDDQVYRLSNYAMDVE